MSIEQALAENTAALKALAVAIASAGVAGALAAAGEAGKSEEKKGPGRPKKDEPTGKNAETPAGSTQGASSASGKDSAKTNAGTTSGKTWPEVVEKVKELLNSKADGHGKEAVQAVVAKFGKAGEKVGTLEVLGKNDEIFAHVAAVLAGEGAAEESDEDIL